MSILDDVEKQLNTGDIYQIKHDTHEYFKKILNMMHNQQETFNAILKSLVDIKCLLDNGITEITQTDMSLDYENLTSSATTPIRAINRRPFYVFRFDSNELNRLNCNIYDIQNKINRSEIFFNELFADLKQNEQELQNN